VTVVSRTTPAVNYRPRHDDTPLDFQGTSLLPGAKGHANISGEKGYIQIDAKFDKLEPALTRIARRRGFSLKRKRLARVTRTGTRS
jgi:hypothetical protein